MNDDGFGDWRHHAVSRLAKDMAPAYPGGAAHRAGTPIYLSALTRAERGQLYSYIMPSPTALALGLAIRAAKAADTLRGSVSLQRHDSPYGASLGVPAEQASVLYDFFAECMASVTFSFNAIEIFANETVANELKGTYTRSGSKAKELTADKVQRDLSTEEKMAAVLPAIRGTASPRDSELWGDFRRLKQARDTTIHMKPTDALVNGREIDKQSLFYEFFSMKSVVSYPTFAVALIGFFFQGRADRPRWLVHADALIGT